MEITAENLNQFRFICSRCPANQEEIDRFLSLPQPTIFDKFNYLYNPEHPGALRTISMDALTYLIQVYGGCFLAVGEINHDGVLRLLCFRDNSLYFVIEPNFALQRVEFASIRLYSFYTGEDSGTSTDSGRSVGSGIGPTLSSPAVALPASSSSSSGSVLGPIFPLPGSSTSGGAFGRTLLDIFPSLGSGSVFGRTTPSAPTTSRGTTTSSSSRRTAAAAPAPAPAAPVPAAAAGGGGGGGALPQSTAVNTDCAICMDDFSEDDRQISQINCSGPHAYHTQCIQGFQRSGSQRKCPICRGQYRVKRPVRRRPAPAPAPAPVPAPVPALAPAPAPAPASGGGGASSQQQTKIRQLMGLGVTRQVAKQALQAAGGDVNMAGTILVQMM